MVIMDSRGRLFHAQVLFWYSFPDLQNTNVNKPQNKTKVSAEIVDHNSACIILFIQQHYEKVIEPC